MPDILSSPASEGSRSPNLTAAGMPNAEARAALRKRRTLKDVLAKYFVSIGGFNVILALGLIFAFLFIELIPVFSPARIRKQAQYSVAPLADVVRDEDWTAATSFNTDAPPLPAVLVMDLDRYEEVGLRYTPAGQVVFFNPLDGRPSTGSDLPLHNGQVITSAAWSEPRANLVALGLNDGHVLIVRHTFDLDYTDDIRSIHPRLEFPFGDVPLRVDDQGMALTAIALQRGMDGTALAAVTRDRRLKLVLFSTRISFMTGEVSIQQKNYDLGIASEAITGMLISSNWRNLFVSTADGMLHYYDISRPAEARLQHSLPVVPDRSISGQKVSVTALEFLLGTVSIIVGRSDGTLSQYFLVRDEENQHFITHIRDFSPHPAAITALTAEYTRKGFAAADAAGHVGLHYPTSERTLLIIPVTQNTINRLAFSPTGGGMLAHTDDNRMYYLKVDNPHPEVSLKALWGKIWYEGRAEPTYVWQSSSASDEFESKFSQMPLTLGTLKASFYAMLLAMPLAILGAIYAAYFMSPRLRTLVKPSIEVMEALPTVILGFLAGLWLAPFVENNLPAVFSMVLLLPPCMLLLALLWSRLSERLRLRVPAGWEAALLMPGLLALGWVCITLSPHIEIWFFNGSARQWLTDVGITYDQRNALVVGLAMGFAVIPTIFSIAEDAIFSVPKHLTQGSLALGATSWQTVTRVVLLTASPGIFSAIMIGFGRAVGETMIVLMATGNSPVMNFNIFEGMRTLSANIAVELPETAVGSTHYRILFMAALLLFALTFVVNTAAELVRQHLRKKYSSL